jgi:dipeptidyl aminopeptidase/acylaminoacyl peptidase
MMVRWMMICGMMFLSVGGVLAQQELPPPDDLRFEVGYDITIEALRALTIEGSDIQLEQRLADGANYAQYTASYYSEGLKIYGLLTIPFGDVPPDGFKAIVFNHGYIPPTVYRTTERYIAYVDGLARAGFVVFKIDMRGHGESEGVPSGSYFSPAYTIDAISALKSLQRLDIVDPDGIGMWGHSMAGNLIVRAMLMEPDIKAGVIWGGAVYSYEDLAQYGITDTSFTGQSPSQNSLVISSRTRIYDLYGAPDLSHPYWQAVALTANLHFLEGRPLQIHHSSDDDVVSIRYAMDLAEALAQNNIPYEFYPYQGGGHNINSPYFDTAMQRTIQFFMANL